MTLEDLIGSEMSGTRRLLGIPIKISTELKSRPKA